MGLSVVICMTVSADDSITIIKSTESEFHFKVAIDPYTLSSVVDTNSVEYRFKPVQFAIPFGATVRVEKISYSRSVTTAYNQALSPAHSYELSGPIEVRGVQLMMLRLYPVTYNSCFTEAEVHLLFSGGSSTAGNRGSTIISDTFLRKFVSNYEQAESFSKQRTVQKTVQITGPFNSQSSWVKLDVGQTGLYRVTGADLENAGIVLTSLSIDDIHLFSGGGLRLPVDNSVARPEFKEVAIQVVDDGDNVFEANDYFLFFGEGIDRWVYSANQAPQFSNHPYSKTNTYWVGIDVGTPVRWTTRDGGLSGTEDTVVQDFSKHVRVEADQMLRKLKSGRTFDYFSWYWTNEPGVDFFVGSPGRVIGDTAQIYLSALTSDPTGPGDADGFVNAYVNGVGALNKACNQKFCTYKTTSLVDGLNQVHLDMWGSGSSEPYFDYLELVYKSSLLPIGGQLDFAVGSTIAHARIDIIDNLGSQIALLDISDPLSPIELTNFDRGSGTISFSSQLSSVGPNRFFLIDLSKLLRPIVVKKAFPTDLYTADQQTDLIIVVADNLASAMDEYIEYRESQGYTIKLVSVSDIMDNFAFGLYDPTAIRDFLKYAYENYPVPSPSGVLFVGDGTYDYLDILGTGMQNFVPPYLLQPDDPTSDDNYVFFGEYGILDGDTSYTLTDRGFDMYTGRWPVRSRSEINTFVSKIKKYESASSYGPWRNSITLVADDEHGQANNETIHTIQTTQLDKEHIPSSFNRNRIYLWDYPFVNQYKPAVNDIIVQSINTGKLIVNYVGHGNPDVWAHERVFTRDGDLPRLNNFDKLPLFFAASCAIGFFDDPQREGMAEELLTHPTGGCIGTISATRLVYSSENAAFNRQVFDVLLTHPNLSISEALYLGKLERQYRFGSIPVPVVNDRTYAYFGDPLLKLGMPRLEVEFGAVPDSLTALSTIHIDGRVRSASGALYTADGTLYINVFDTEREKTYRLVNDNGTITQSVDYSVNGPAVYRGTASITAGEFSFDFITPLDIGYGGLGARITTYAEFDGIDGIGLIDSLAISSQITPSTDSSGPKILVSFPRQTDFVSGDPILPGSQLKVELSDSSGINLTGGLGHGITLIVDGRSEDVINLSPAFSYDQDDFTSGELTYNLDNISPGQHSFKIKAWDNANNSSSMTFSAQVLASEAPAIVELLNYPNPMQESTRFSFRLTQPVSRFTLEIYTLSGRKIKSFVMNPMSPGFFDDIIWYGDDYAGDRVATGVYVYKAVATPETGGDAIESFGKVVVVN